jgi:hypothetical protein
LSGRDGELQHLVGKNSTFVGDLLGMHTPEIKTLGIFYTVNREIFVALNLSVFESTLIKFHVCYKNLDNVLRVEVLALFKFAI